MSSYCKGAVSSSFDFDDVALETSGGPRPYTFTEIESLSASVQSCRMGDGSTDCTRTMNMHIRFSLTIGYTDANAGAHTAEGEFTRCVSIEVPRGKFCCADFDLYYDVEDIDVTFCRGRATANLTILLTVCPGECCAVASDSSCGCCASCASCGCAGDPAVGAITLPYGARDPSCACACSDSDGWYASDAWIRPDGSTYYSSITCYGSSSSASCGCSCGSGCSRCGS